MADEVPTGITIRVLKAVFNYMKAWFKLPFTLKEIEKKIEPKPISKNARFCPNCDTRMIAGGVYGKGHRYSCPKCYCTQSYDTIHT